MKVSVVGINGRMGQEIVLSAKDLGIKIEYGISRSGLAPGAIKSSMQLDRQVAKATDVLIDFSTVENFDSVCAYAAKEKIPLVSGVTGLSKENRKKLLQAAKKTAVLWSPNMSIGVAALRKALSAFSELEDFDFQIEEFHHNKKKDNPSGTALHLQEALEKSVGRACPAPIGIRGGGIFGVHKVYAMSDEEVLVFEHQALNRRVFAKGALRAALWLRNKKPGLYGMQDMLLD